jgi:nucleoside-triphosphatase
MTLRILLEGRPGVGKTTVARRLADELRVASVRLAGFTTEELREGGQRMGFVVESMEGEWGVRAHVDLPGPPRVGRYGVDLAVLERLAVPALETAMATEGLVAVVDELGRMELASERFCRAVTVLLEQPVDVVATVHVASHPFTDRLEGRPDVEVVAVTPGNRDRLPSRLARRLAGDVECGSW